MMLLTDFVIDWANSNYSGATGSGYQIEISGWFDATWLNAMFTALPTVTSKTIDVRYCDGYATCTKTIATAKGWTVL